MRSHPVIALAGSLVAACSAPPPTPAPIVVTPAAVVRDASLDAPGGTADATILVSAPDAELLDAAEFDCAEACTNYAVCWEQVHKGEDFRGGFRCTASCEHMAPADQPVWAAKILAAQRANKCKRVVED